MTINAYTLHFPFLSCSLCISIKREIFEAQTLNPIAPPNRKFEGPKRDGRDLLPVFSIIFDFD
jgi:hypothetical protein